MSFAERFEELEIWQQARALNKNVYALLKKCDDYSFRDQMRRASLSVMNNISEGFERRTKKDFAHFLDLARLGWRGAKHDFRRRRCWHSRKSCG